MTSSLNRSHRGFACTLNVRLELVPELLDTADDWSGAGIAQHTDRLARHVVRQIEQQLEVLLLALTGEDPLEDPRGPGGAFPALGALSARFVGVEASQAPDLVHHVRGVVHDDHSG